MPEHQLVMRKIVVVGGGLILALLLPAIGKPLGVDGQPAFLASTLLFCVLGVVSLRWLVTALQAVTGFMFLIPLPVLVILYVAAAGLSVFIAPIGLLCLVIQYFRERRRYRRPGWAGGYRRPA